MAWLREVGLGERIVVLCLWTISAALELLDAVHLARDWLLIKIIII